jgi:hypothetical protein
MRLGRIAVAIAHRVALARDEEVPVGQVGARCRQAGRQADTQAAQAQKRSSQVSRRNLEPHSQPYWGTHHTWNTREPVYTTPRDAGPQCMPLKLCNMSLSGKGCDWVVSTSNTVPSRTLDVQTFPQAPHTILVAVLTLKELLQEVQHVLSHLVLARHIVTRVLQKQRGRQNRTLRAKYASSRDRQMQQPSRTHPYAADPWTWTLHEAGTHCVLLVLAACAANSWAAGHSSLDVSLATCRPQSTQQHAPAASCRHSGTHPAVAVACVDGLVHVDDAGVLVPAKGVVQQRHVVRQSVWAIFCVSHNSNSRVVVQADGVDVNGCMYSF